MINHIEVVTRLHIVNRSYFFDGLQIKTSPTRGRGSTSSKSSPIRSRDSSRRRSSILPDRKERSPHNRRSTEEKSSIRKRTSPPGRRDVREKSPLRIVPSPDDKDKCAISEETSNEVYGSTRATLLTKSLISNRRRRGHTPPDRTSADHESSKVDWLNRPKQLSNADKARIFGKAEAFSPPFIKDFVPSEEQLNGMPQLKVIAREQ